MDPTQSPHLLPLQAERAPSDSSSTLATLPNDIMHLIAERILESEIEQIRNDGSMDLDWIAARSLVALRHTSRDWMRAVDQVLRGSLSLHVSVRGNERDASILASAAQLPLLVDTANPNMRFVANRATGAGLILTLNGVQEDLPGGKPVIYVPDFRPNAVLSVATHLISSLVISGPEVPLPTLHGEQSGYGALCRSLFTHLAHCFVRITSLDLTLVLPMTAMNHALQLWSSTLTHVRIVVPFPWVEGAQHVLLPYLRSLDVEVRWLDSHEQNGMEAPFPFVTPALNQLRVAAPCVHARFFEQYLNRLTPTLSSLIVDTVQISGPPTAKPPVWPVLQELDIPAVAVGSLIDPAHHLLPQLRTLKVRPDSNFLVPVPLHFPPDLHIANVELHFHMADLHCLGSLSAAAPQLATLTLAWSNIDVRGIPVHPAVFPVLKKLVLQSRTGRRIAGVISTFDLPQVEQFAIHFYHQPMPMLPFTVELWPSVTSITLTALSPLRMHASLLDSLPRLATLDLQARISWAKDVVPRLATVTKLTASDVALRGQLGRAPETLHNLVELVTPDVLEIVPVGAVSSLRRVIAPAVHAIAIRFLSRVPALVAIRTQRVQVGVPMPFWSLVYRQGHPVWRILPRMPCLSALARRIDIEVAAVIDVEQAVQEIRKVLFWAVKNAVAQQVPVHVRVAKSVKEPSLVPRIQAMLDGLAANGVLGSVDDGRVGEVGHVLAATSL